MSSGPIRQADFERAVNLRVLTNKHLAIAAAAIREEDGILRRYEEHGMATVTEGKEKQIDRFDGDMARLKAKVADIAVKKQKLRAVEKRKKEIDAERKRLRK